MQLSIIIEAACVFHVLHLVVCHNTLDWNCHKKYTLGDESVCWFEAVSETQTLKAFCIKKDTTPLKNSISTEEPFRLNPTKFPSLKEIWNRCAFSGGVPSIQLNNFTEINVLWVNNDTMKIPDDFFCDWTNITKIIISDRFLTDSTKLGFKSLRECDTRCITNITRLNVLRSSLTKISNDSFCGLDQLITLLIEHGTIAEVESDAFVHLLSLKVLDLENNSISVLRPGVFRKLENLQYLDLRDNILDGSSIEELRNLKQLSYLLLAHNEIDVLPAGIFDEMGQLVDLWLDDNFLTTLQGALTELTNLESLSINVNQITKIHSEDFKNLVNLKLIHLHNNPIIEFDPESFTNCNKLIEINFDNTSLSTVPPFISKARELKELDLSYNNLNKIDIGVFDEGEDIHMIDLSFNNLTQITDIFTYCTVKHLILDHNRLTKLSFTDFSYDLIDLSITHNRIQTIDSSSDLLEQSWAMQLLNLSHNHFTALTDLNLPISLTLFDVRNNTIEHMSYTDDYIQIMLTNNSTDITRLYLQNNAFKVICPHLTLLNKPMEIYIDGNPLICSCENLWLSLPFQHNHSKQLIVADFETLACQHQFQRLAKQSLLVETARRDFLCSSIDGCSCAIDINNQPSPIKTCDLKCPSRCTCYNNIDKSITHIDCSSKNLKTLPLRPIDQFNLAHELYVYLDNNSISKIQSNAFFGLNNTIKMYLNNTGLCEMEDGSLDHLTKMKVLHLEHNNIRHISETVFERLSSLTQLFLSHNRIQTVASNAFPSQLQTLYLDNNRLVEFNVWELTNLTEFNLHGNRWSCECQFAEQLRNWILKFSDSEQMAITLFCELPSGKEYQLQLLNFTSEHCHKAGAVNIFTSNYAEIWMWVLGLFACLTIIAITIFIYRREVQVLIYSRVGVRLFYSGEKDELDGKYFDAFIAYSCVDEDFLVNTLMPGLEHIDEPYKLCLHHRNFLGGASIISSIMEAVQFSTRTIILLSDNFMRSEWCRFEFQQAYIQMLKDRCNRLLVIIIHEVPANLDPEMRVYLRTNTYLKWGDALFWKKLYFAMPERVEPRLAQLRASSNRVPREELPM